MKRNYVTVPRTVSAGGIEATVNVRFSEYGASDNVRFYVGVSEVAKAIKALMKNAGFDVIKCASQSFSGGDAVDVSIRSELTKEQIESNNLKFSEGFSRSHPDVFKEPREQLADKICWSFEGGRFNGMEDIYEYSENPMTVEDPKGIPVNFTAKYVTVRFEEE